jgi:methyl-accepting chemotaxis protein
VGINVEGVRDAVSTIVEALSAQLTACTEVATAVDEIREGTHAHQGRTQSIDAAISSMLEQANALREEVGRFEI